MRIFAILIFGFFSILSLLIYLTKNYQYEKYQLVEKSSIKKTYLINVNLGTWHDFASLPGISDNLARKIIKNREERGRFNEVSEIMRVKGIGQKKFELIKEYLTLDV
jgi:competence ComEA-like helix-hairpin-helix protein